MTNDQRTTMSLTEFSIHRPRTPHHKVVERRKLVKEMIVIGLTNAEMATRLDVSEATVQKDISKLGLTKGARTALKRAERRRRLGDTQEREEPHNISVAATEMRDSGMTRGETASQLGLNYTDSRLGRIKKNYFCHQLEALWFVASLEKSPGHFWLGGSDYEKLQLLDAAEQAIAALKKVIKVIA